MPITEEEDDYDCHSDCLCTQKFFGGALSKMECIFIVIIHYWGDEKFRKI
jgi:hypothetical protein